MNPFAFTPVFAWQSFDLLALALAAAPADGRTRIPDGRN